MGDLTIGLSGACASGSDGNDSTESDDNDDKDDCNDHACKDVNISSCGGSRLMGIILEVDVEGVKDSVNSLLLGMLTENENASQKVDVTLANMMAMTVLLTLIAIASCPYFIL